MYVKYFKKTGVKTDNTKDFIFKLNKTLYGLKQALRVWYNTLTIYFKKLKFQSLTADLNVFKRNNIFVTVYINDLFIIRPAKNDITAVKRALNDRFKINDLKPISYYLGIKITKN